MVAPKAIPRARSYAPTSEMARLDADRDELARILSLCPFIRGRLVSVTFASGVRKVVRHGLGVAAACLVARMNYDSAENGPLFTEDSDQTTNCDATQQLAITCNVVCTVDLWFYPRASKPVDTGLGQSL